MKSNRDFVVWMKSDVHIERIYPDEDFWLTNVAKVKEFFFKLHFYQSSWGNYIPMTSFVNIAKVQSYCYHKNLLAVEHQWMLSNTIKRAESSEEEEDDNVKLAIVLLLPAS